MPVSWLHSIVIVLTFLAVSGRVLKRSIDTAEGKNHFDDYRLPKSIIPTGYHLELIPYPSEGHFRGHVHMNVSCQESTHTIVLHAYEHLRIVHQQVTVRLIRGPVRRVLLETANSLYEGNSITMPEFEEPLPISSISRDPNKDRFTITMLEELEKGATYQVDLEFYGALDSEGSEGFFRGSYENSEATRRSWYAATKMSPSNARRIFPCFDEPSFKAPFKISVARYTRMSTLSNMPLQAIEITDEQGWVWDHFPPTPPISTFSVGFIISDFKSHNPYTMPGPRGGVTVHFHGRNEFLKTVEGSLRIATRMVEYLEEYLSVRYPLKKLDIVALPEYKGRRPADHLGLILFQEAELTDEAGQSRLIHEIVYQWLSHIVTPHWWTDLYVTNALGRYLATAGLLKLIDKENWAPMLQHSAYYEYSSQHPYYSTPDFKHDSITNREDEFWATLTHQAHRDGTLHDSISVGRIARSWLRKDCHRFPVVTVLRNYNENSATLEQHVFIREQPHLLTEDENEMLWWIPIAYLSPENMDPSTVLPIAWMKGEKFLNITYLPDADSFIIVNPTDSGMFMVNYDHHNWGLLAQYLQGSRQKVPVATRMKLLHDAWNLALGNELDFGVALDMTLFLLNETEPSVWDIMFTMIDHTGRHLRKTSEYVRRLMTPMYEYLGQPRRGESAIKTEFRFNAHCEICGTGYQPCIDSAREALGLILPILESESNETESYDDLVCVDVMWNETDDWVTPAQKLVQFLADRSYPERIYLLKQMENCPDYDYMVERILNGTLEETNTTVSDTDWQLFINLIVGSNKGHSLLFSFLSQNFDELQERWVSEFYAKYSRKLGTAVSYVEEAMKDVNEEITWGRSNLPAIDYWLDLVLPHFDDIVD
ncbi:hypothetical protein C0J52_08612 [Blattella germanica]|nr:hypothetical protein C0J52_08612 [Blattella germanica]